MGDKSIRNIIARMYVEGLGVNKNLKKAYNIYSKLAFENDPNG